MRKIKLEICSSKGLFCLLSKWWYRNGKTGGITRPSCEGQEAVIRQAYERSGLDVASTQYIECHGTGTPVGDPLEMSAIGRVFTDNHSVSDPLLVGSVS